MYSIRGAYDGLTLEHRTSRNLYERQSEHTDIISLMFFIVVGRKRENIHFLSFFNPKIQFTIQLGADNSLNFLYKTVKNGRNTLEFNTYRKATV